MERNHIIFKKGIPLIKVKTNINDFTEREKISAKRYGILPKNTITITSIKLFSKLS